MDMSEKQFFPRRHSGKLHKRILQAAEKLFCRCSSRLKQSERKLGICENCRHN